MERVAYFVVRVNAVPGDARADVSGVVERLASGEKRSFANGGELVRLLVEWVATVSPPPTRGDRPGG